MIYVILWLVGLACVVAAVFAIVLESFALAGLAVALGLGMIGTWVNAIYLPQRKAEKDQQDKREQEEQAGRAETRKREEAAKEEQERRDQFQEIRFWPDPTGERRFVWKYPGGWPGDREGPPRELTSDEWFWVVAEIPHSAPDWRARPIPKSEAATAEGPFVYETDADYRSAHRVVGRLIGVGGGKVEDYDVKD